MYEKIMKIKLYFFGKQNEINEREKELIQRIGFRVKIEVIPIKQIGIKNAQENKEKEANALLEKIGNKEFVVAFDEKGKELDSKAFSSWLKKKLIDFQGVSFVIGGTYGLGEKALKRANEKISFSKMVWTRNLVRHMALEQIYRALEIDGGSNFHKE